MHSGYPIVTELDVATPGFNYLGNGFLFDVKFNRRHGGWGLMHEIGHNMQRDTWTPDELGETTNNIFALYSMKKVVGIENWIHPQMKMEGQWPEVVTYIQNDGPFPPSAWVYLYFFDQLAHYFDWDAYKHVFRKYEDLIKKKIEPK